MRRRVRSPNSVLTRQGLTSPFGLVTVTLPHFQHHTAPRTAASECVWCAMRRPLQMNPENSRGANDLEVQRTRLILVLSASLTLGLGRAGGGRSRPWGQPRRGTPA